MTAPVNQHYFLVVGTLNADGTVSFEVDDDCGGFITERPIWTGDEWVSADGELSVADADIRDALIKSLEGKG